MLLLIAGIQNFLHSDLIIIQKYIGLLFSQDPGSIIIRVISQEIAPVHHQDFPDLNGEPLTWL